MLEITSEKHPAFADQIDCRDSELFMSIPCLIILKCIDNDDHGFCVTHYPDLSTAGSEAQTKMRDLQSLYTKEKNKRAGSSFEFYNHLEALILGMNTPSTTQGSGIHAKRGQLSLQGEKEVTKIVSDIKLLGMMLSRHNPSEWNEFVDACLGSEVI